MRSSGTTLTAATSVDQGRNTISWQPLRKSMQCCTDKKINTH